MRKGLKVAGAVLLCIVLLFGLGWAVQGNSFFIFKVFNPKIEQVRRNTFEQSRAFNEGQMQHLASIQAQFATATPEQQKALAQLVMQNYAAYDVSKLTPQLQDFYYQCQTLSMMGQ
jgi:hypothetical protein